MHTLLFFCKFLSFPLFFLLLLSGNVGRARPFTVSGLPPAAAVAGVVAAADAGAAAAQFPPDA